MIEINNLVEAFLKDLETSRVCAQVKFSIDYTKKHIVIHSAPSGFMRNIYSNDRFCAHLTEGGVLLTMFR